MRTNEDNSLYALNDDYQSKLVLFELYSSIDVIIFLYFNSCIENGIFIKDIDNECLTANCMGRTFFSLFYDNHHLIQIAYNQI